MERENCLKALLRRIDLSKKIIIYCERIEQTVRIANIIKPGHIHSPLSG